MPRSVSILAGYYNVELPNGNIYQATNKTGGAGPTVILSDEEFAKVGLPLLGIQDNGNVGTSLVANQAAYVAAAAALTTADTTVTTGNTTVTTADASVATATAVTLDGTYADDYAAIQTAINDLITDVASIRTKFNLAVTDIGNIHTQFDLAVTDIGNIHTEFDKAVTDLGVIRTALNAELAALQVAGGPQASS